MHTRTRGHRHVIDVGDTHPRTGHRWRSRWLWLALSRTVIGTVEYREDYEIALMSWEPQR
ncbi:MAG TPA: hypothetical protein VF015_11030 [Acidimicrobiales bacterium]